MAEEQPTDVAVIPVMESGQKFTPRKETLQRVGRTGLQLVAAGGLTALTNQIANDVPTAYSVYILAGYTFALTWVQNLVEETWPQFTILKK